ncbi:unnamed protein product, partial [Closterium sp. NIES-54]
MFQVCLHRWRAVRRPLSVFVASAFLLLLLSLAWLPASRSQDAQIGGAGGGDGAGRGGGAGNTDGAGDASGTGDGAASGLADFIGGYAGDAGSGLSNAGESGSGSSGTGDSGESGSGNGGRASNRKFKGVFELPDPPSRFNARAAWHHMRYRTPDACWSQQERHLYHTADQSHPSQAFVDAVVAFEAMQRECVSQGGVEDWQWVRNRKDWDQGVPRYGPDRKPCRYIMIHDLSRGVGNRIVSYVISFVLGLLTNRAIITPPDGFLTRRFCNPFARANTSWTVQPAVY